MSVLKEIPSLDWSNSFEKGVQSEAIEAIEGGKILFFPQLSFNLLPSEKGFLSPHYADSKSKNISLDSKTGLLRGIHASEKEQYDIKKMMMRFSQNAQTLLQQLLPSYVAEIGRTSFRPVEVVGRESSYRKDDTRLHVDAFPATPNQGKRILRVFTNINPNNQDRVWRVGESFKHVAETFLPHINKPWPGSRRLLKALRITRGYRTLYDHYMLHIHDRMKADLNYQKTASQCEIRFPAYSSWIVQTDQVSHAAMSGQYVLEQTFYMSVHKMNNPSYSPLQILEKLKGFSLT